MRLKVWVVGWKTRDVRAFANEDYVPRPHEPIDVEPLERFKVECRCPVHLESGKNVGWHYGSSMAVFGSRKEAEVWGRESFSIPASPTRRRHLINDVGLHGNVC